MKQQQRWPAAADQCGDGGPGRGNELLLEVGKELSVGERAGPPAYPLWIASLVAIGCLLGLRLPIRTSGFQCVAPLMTDRPSRPQCTQPRRAAWRTRGAFAAQVACHQTKLRAVAFPRDRGTDGSQGLQGCFCAGSGRSRHNQRRSVCRLPDDHPSGAQRKRHSPAQLTFLVREPYSGPARNVNRRGRGHGVDHGDEPDVALVPRWAIADVIEAG